MSATTNGVWAGIARVATTERCVSPQGQLTSSALQLTESLLRVESKSAVCKGEFVIQHNTSCPCSISLDAAICGKALYKLGIGTERSMAGCLASSKLQCVLGQAPASGSLELRL